MLQTDVLRSGFYRTSREEPPPHKHREARNAPEISTLPDNMTRVVVRPFHLHPPPAAILDRQGSEKERQLKAEQGVAMFRVAHI